MWTIYCICLIFITVKKLQLGLSLSGTRVTRECSPCPFLSSLFCLCKLCNLKTDYLLSNKTIHGNVCFCVRHLL
ncbi:hypothetical protein AMELA_G00026140 [Ameiurus melas]|uniref:Secreted protein n=1 Tax=Ameiurus melas TaxID=219545 RepID=A0A7J6BDJ6_AMEME|nr:hypothetical protein AMELA_G00026140 [Ameiurus melas]